MNFTSGLFSTKALLSNIIRLFIRMHMMANYQPFVVVVLFYNNNNVFFKQANYVVMLQKEEAFLDLMGYM